MSTTVETRVEYDDRFRQRPELVKAAEEAMAYLDPRLGTNPLVPPPAVIRWGVRPLDPQSVELAMADGDGLRATRVFPARQLADPVIRNIWGLKVWDDLLSERSRVNLARLDRRMAAFARDIPDDWDAPDVADACTPEGSPDGR